MRAHERRALLSLGDLHAAAAPPAFDEAEAHYADALALAEELSMSPVVAQRHLGLGRLHRRAGREERAREHLAIAAAMYREMGMGLWLAPAETELQAIGAAAVVDFGHLAAHAEGQPARIVWPGATEDRR